MQFAPGGLRYGGLAFLLALPALFVSVWVSIGFLGCAGFILWFYRDPDRVIPQAGIVAPADGRVTVIREENGRVRVGVFMGVRDVHVNRAPYGGTVQEITHKAGANRPAFSKDSARNERVHITFNTIETVLIAGSFARRITPYVEVGEIVGRGDRIGHIAFGSRADVLLPYGIDRGDVEVEEGTRVVAGETVIAPSFREHEQTA